MSITELLSEIKTKIRDVYEAGKAAGGISEFWDAYQDNGKRTDYTVAFAGKGWTKETFKPKYDIVPTTTTQMFGRNGLKDVDLVEHLRKLEKNLDFSKCTSFTEVFYYTGITRIGEIDTRSCSNLNTIFAYTFASLETVELLRLKEDGSQTFAKNSFIQCTGLTNITIAGVIGKGGIELQWSTKLSKASITSFIEALSTSTSGLTITFSTTAVNNAFTSEEWEALKSNKSNWEIKDVQI